MSAETELVVTLRDAALRRDWNGCRDAAEAALSRLPIPKMLRLAHHEVERRLPLFERHHPDIHWPRIWLSVLATGSPGTLDETSPEVAQEAPGPGGNNFTDAVLALFDAATADSKKCLTHTIEAIAGAIVAETTEVGGSENRELWDLWFQDALTGDESLYPDALATINANPKVAAITLAAWNRLADELSAALDLPSTSQLPLGGGQGEER